MKRYVITKSSGERFEADAVIFKGLDRWAVIHSKSGKEEVKILDGWVVSLRSFA